MEEGILGGYGGLVIGGVDDMFGKEGGVMDEKIDWKEGGKGLVWLYQRNWVGCEECFNVKDGGNGLGGGRGFGDVKVG